jgi:hypothetical protein
MAALVLAKSLTLLTQVRDVGCGWVGRLGVCFGWVSVLV